MLLSFHLPGTGVGGWQTQKTSTGISFSRVTEHVGWQHHKLGPLCLQLHSTGMGSQLCGSMPNRPQAGGYCRGSSRGRAVGQQQRAHGDHAPGPSRLLILSCVASQRASLCHWQSGKYSMSTSGVGMPSPPRISSQTSDCTALITCSWISSSLHQGCS